MNQIKEIRKREKQDYPYQINRVKDLYHGQRILILKYPTSKIKRIAIHGTIDQISRRSFRGLYYIRLKEGQIYDGFYHNYRCVVWNDGYDNNIRRITKQEYQMYASKQNTILSKLYWTFRRMYLTIYHWTNSEKLYHLANIDLIEPSESSTDYSVF